MKTDKTISIIVALAQNNAIGRDNDLLWHIPEDLKRFKRVTSGNTIVMGRKTYLSLPTRPLPNRLNIVISDIPDETFEGCVMASSIEDAVSKMQTDKENFIIGGGSIYRQFLPIADKLYLTFIHNKAEDADVFFPEIDFAQWIEIEREESDAATNTIPHTYAVYSRKPK
jgi:dihydrofolate reductase